MGEGFFSSKPGRELLVRIERNLDVVVPGLWMDPGTVPLFTICREPSSFNDFAGLRVRVAGGISNKMRVEAFGADGVTIPWPDLSPRIQGGSGDGVLTTFETVRSASLWKDGIRYALWIMCIFSSTYPRVSRHTWSRLTSKQRLLVISS